MSASFAFALRQLVLVHGVVVVRKQQPNPLPVQGDGEVIGQTPVRIEVLPSAVPVIVPAAVRGGWGIPLWPRL